MKIFTISRISSILISGFIFCSFQPEDNSFKETESGVRITYDRGYLEVKVWSDRIVEVIYSPKDEMSKSESLIVNKEFIPVPFQVNSNENDIELITGRLKVIINKKSGLIQFFDRSGKQIMAEKSRYLNKRYYCDEPVYQISQKWQLAPDEGIFGLGQHQDGIMNYRDSKVTLVQTNTVAANPFLISTRNYGILWDNYSKTVFKDNATGAEFWSEIADRIDYYFVYGDNMDDVIAGYRELTGTAPMFGKWAFGYWQSKERYVDADDLLSVVKRYRLEEIPIDNIVQDWCYWADYDKDDAGHTWQSAKKQWSSMKFDPSTYPKPEETIKEIHEKYNMHYMISIWPALGPETDIYKELKSKGLTYKPEHWSSGYLYDTYSEEARNIYWKYVKEGLIDKGVDALWMDGTEPELGDQHTFEVSEENIKSFGQTALGPMAKYMNTYSLMTTDGAYQNFRKDVEGKRLLILTRSGFAGQQRNAAVTWSGDINANWNVFRKQISAGINFCMAGIPYWTTDIGAFFVKGHEVDDGPGMYPEGCTDPAYREFYLRWFQFGAFSPIFRSHGTNTPREVWQFGDKESPFYKSLLKFDNLRYRLMPYIYSIAWKVTNDGYTIMRGLPMDFPNDIATYGIDNQYMFGSSLMVSPVTEEQYYLLNPTVGNDQKKIGSVDVYLPAGVGWFDFWTGEKFEGGKTISRETPLDIMPLFVKEGSIVPMGPKLQYATEKQADPIELRIYSGADASFVLYEDENDNYNYEKGIYATINIDWNELKQQLTIGERLGKFPGMLKRRIFNIVWVEKNHGAEMEAESKPDKTVEYSGGKIIVSR